MRRRRSSLSTASARSLPALKVDTWFSKATRCAHGTGAWKTMHVPALRVHGTQMCIPQLSHSVSCEVWDCSEGMKRRVPFLAQAGEGHGNMLAARSITFSVVSTSAVSAGELAIASAPSKAAHAKNENWPAQPSKEQGHAKAKIASLCLAWSMPVVQETHTACPQSKSVGCTSASPHTRQTSVGTSACASSRSSRCISRSIASPSRAESPCERSTHYAKRRHTLHMLGPV